MPDELRGTPPMRGRPIDERIERGLSLTVDPAGGTPHRIDLCAADHAELIESTGEGNTYSSVPVTLVAHETNSYVVGSRSGSPPARIHTPI